jgi:hypothetical protein
VQCPEDVARECRSGKREGAMAPVSTALLRNAIDGADKEKVKFLLEKGADSNTNSSRARERRRAAAALGQWS